MPPDQMNSTSDTEGNKQGLLRLEVEIPEACRQGSVVHLRYRVTNSGEETLEPLEMELTKKTLRLSEDVEPRSRLHRALIPGATVEGRDPLIIRPRYEGDLPLELRIVFETPDGSPTIVTGLTTLRVDPLPSGSVQVGDIHIGDQIRSERGSAIDASGREQSDLTLRLMTSASGEPAARQWREVTLEIDATLTETMRAASAAEIPAPARDDHQNRALLLRWTDHRGPVMAAVAVGSRLTLGRAFGQAEIPVGRMAAVFDPAYDEQWVSRTHAAVHLDPAGVRVEDLNSANGVFLDGRRVPTDDPQLLRSSSSLAIGRKLPFVVKTLIDTADLARRSRGASRESMLDLAQKMTAANPSQRLSGIRLALHAATGQRGRAWIALLHPAAQASLGSQHGNVFTLRAKRVADFHARLLALPQGLGIVDLGSREGTAINGRRLEPNQPEPLRPGDRIGIGEVTVEVGDFRDL